MVERLTPYRGASERVISVPPVRLTQPWEHTSHHHPGFRQQSCSHNLSHCPPLPWSHKSQQTGLKRTGAFLLSHTEAPSYIWGTRILRQMTLLHTYTQIHIYTHNPSLQTHTAKDIQMCTYANTQLTCSKVYLYNWTFLVMNLFPDGCVQDFPHLPWPLQGRAQLFHEQPHHIHALYCGETLEEYATCHSPLMHLAPLLCGRLTPTQKPLFSRSTRAQVAGGGKVELQAAAPAVQVISSLL